MRAASVRWNTQAERAQERIDLERQWYEKHDPCDQGDSGWVDEQSTKFDGDRHDLPSEWRRTKMTRKAKRVYLQEHPDDLPVLHERVWSRQDKRKYKNAVTTCAPKFATRQAARNTCKPKWRARPSKKSQEGDDGEHGCGMLLEEDGDVVLSFDKPKIAEQ